MFGDKPKLSNTFEEEQIIDFCLIVLVPVKNSKIHVFIIYLPKKKKRFKIQKIEKMKIKIKKLKRRILKLYLNKALIKRIWIQQIKL